METQLQKGCFAACKLKHTTTGQFVWWLPRRALPPWCKSTSNNTLCPPLSLFLQLFLHWRAFHRRRESEPNTWSVGWQGYTRDINARPLFQRFHLCIRSSSKEHISAGTLRCLAVAANAAACRAQQPLTRWNNTYASLWSALKYTITIFKCSLSMPLETTISWLISATKTSCLHSKCMLSKRSKVLSVSQGMAESSSPRALLDTALSLLRYIGGIARARKHCLQECLNNSGWYTSAIKTIGRKEL